jgi:hypothetical protein
LILFSRGLLFFVNGRFRERWKWGRRWRKEGDGFEMGKMMAMRKGD